MLELNNELRQAMLEIRDIPYSIPLFYEAEDQCCNGKHKKLFSLFKKHNYDVRWRLCKYKWSDLSLPERLLLIPHEDDCNHVYLEVMMNGDWKDIDITWDRSLEDILPVNNYENTLETQIAVPVVSLYSLEESASMMDDERKEIFDEDFKINGKFYEAFNVYLREIRSNKISKKASN